MQKKKIVLISTLIALAASSVLSFYVLDPVYEASTLLMVKRETTQQNEVYYRYDDIIINKMLVNTYEKIIMSKTVLGKVMENFKISMSIGEFKKRVKVNVLEETEMMEIVVENGDPQRAAMIANNIAFVFKQEISRIMEIQNISVIDEAEAPVGSSKPNKPLIIVFATFLGLIGGVFLAFLMDYLDDTIKTPDDVEKYLGMQVIGVVPFDGEAKKRQRREKLRYASKEDYI
ncbi:YveK family protein [Peptoclostridium acidaminophilum]|uniref:YveK family protein n=1 Tax=Peptoclostridium acidaminophilum TaxID=1731 RepID=UPI002ADE38FD|nr:Wzz/FepE/Etk N-terminal domain-containing protein [Peptoclostridium acidaminophilum]